MAYKDKKDQSKKAAECYKKNKDKYKRKAKENNKRYKQRNREYINAYKTNVGCSQCGYNANPKALDFHHIDVNDKESNIAKLVNSSLSIDTILKEVKKCIVLCAICHRNKH